MLPEGLVWRSGHERGVSLAKHQGPSWAWTSSNGTIYTKEISGDWTTTTEIVDVEVKLQEESAPYGSIDEAILTIRGPMRRIYVHGKGTYIMDDTLIIQDSQLSHEENARWDLPVVIDIELSLDCIPHEGLPLFVLLVWKSKGQGHWVQGLVLREERCIREKRRFSRLGMFDFGILNSKDMGEWIAGCTEQIIELV